MKHYGFNFLWMYNSSYSAIPEPPDLRALDFLVQEGFNFVRIPLDYRFWTDPRDYSVTNQSNLDYLDTYIRACNDRGLHCCINLHRAPGYCINGNDQEFHNLWLDPLPQEAFVKQWTSFAKRWKGVSSDFLSFDLVNEPPEIDQYGMTRAIHEGLIRKTVTAIHEIDPSRSIVVDGLGGGNLAMPELQDLPIIQSGRGYQPMALTHYQATWWVGHKNLDPPQWPHCLSEGKIWTRESIKDHYAPWLAMEAQGQRVHIGEFGCYNKVDNKIALSWFEDLLSLYKEWGWGYSLWNFEGDFGIINHQRPNTHYVKKHGLLVDEALLNLLKDHRD